MFDQNKPQKDYHNFFLCMKTNTKTAIKEVVKITFRGHVKNAFSIFFNILGDVVTCGIESIGEIRNKIV